MTLAWNNRDYYGILLKKVISMQYKKYAKAKDSHIKIKLATSISNLAHTQNTIINDYEGKIDLKAVDEIVKENARLQNQLNAKSQRNAHSYLTPKEQKEQEKFLKLSTAEQKAQQKKWGLEIMEKREARGQTYSEVLP